MSDYWKDFIPAIRTTRLGDCTDSDPELAAAWLGWQACEAKFARLTEKIARLEGENKQLKSQRDCLAVEIEGCTKEQELWHQLHILLVPVSSTPYNGLIEAAEELKAECERLRVDANSLRITYSEEDGLFLVVMAPSGKQGGIVLDTKSPILRAALIELAVNLDKQAQLTKDQP